MPSEQERLSRLYPTTKPRIVKTLNPTILSAIPVIPLDDVILPTFPVEAFPFPLGSMIDAVAKATETPVELAAMMGLATVAACCQRLFEISAAPGYSEPLNLWLVAALESGNRKTAVHQKMTEPLRAKERELCAQSKDEIAKAESARATTEARIKVLRSRLADSDDFADIADGQAEIDKLLAEMPPVPIPPRLWAQDITPEKLGTLMADNSERMALLSDEGGIFDILAGRCGTHDHNDIAFLSRQRTHQRRADKTEPGGTTE